MVSRLSTLALISILIEVFSFFDARVSYTWSMHFIYSIPVLGCRFSAVSSSCSGYNMRDFGGVKGYTIGFNNYGCFPNLLTSLADILTSRWWLGSCRTGEETYKLYVIISVQFYRQFPFRLIISICFSSTFIGNYCLCIRWKGLPEGNICCDPGFTGTSITFVLIHPPCFGFPFPVN